MLKFHDNSDSGVNTIRGNSSGSLITQQYLLALVSCPLKQPASQLSAGNVMGVSEVQYAEPLPFNVNQSPSSLLYSTLLSLPIAQLSRLSRLSRLFSLQGQKAAQLNSQLTANHQACRDSLLFTVSFRASKYVLVPSLTCRLLELEPFSEPNQSGAVRCGSVRYHAHAHAYAAIMPAPHNITTHLPLDPHYFPKPNS